MTFIIDGTNGETFPDSTTQATAFTGSANTITSGTLASARLPAGTVLQVVTNTITGAASGASTSSSSFVTTGLAVSITPKFSTSKIMIFVDGAAYNGTAGNTWFTVYRGSTNLNSGASPASLSAFYNPQAWVGNVNIMFLDSPATTSSTTYTVYFATGSGTVTYPFNPSNGGSTIATITVQEIAA
jgi:hypothetical protein